MSRVLPGTCLLLRGGRVRSISRRTRIQVESTTAGVRRPPFSILLVKRRNSSVCRTTENKVFNEKINIEVENVVVKFRRLRT